MCTFCCSNINCVIIFIASFVSLNPISKSNCPSSSIVNKTRSAISTLHMLDLDGHLGFNYLEVDHAARDFGSTHYNLPNAVLYPKSVADISSIIKRIYEMGSSSKLTVAAKGRGHSIYGQAQAFQGIVVYMESLKDREMEVCTGDNPYVDVSGGELWIDVLHKTLERGLTPKSWTDYLHLTVGGTLSNAGISGQAFRHGPQIDNVLQLEVVTGKGEVIACSKHQHEELFNSVLGGLGQFGIITRARLTLAPAPTKVLWIRFLYDGFDRFAKDQESLIATSAFDYIEGFAIVNKTGILNSWRSSFVPADPHQAGRFVSHGTTFYCLELAKYFHVNDLYPSKDEIKRMLSELAFIQSTLFMAQVSYVDFLDRVYSSETKLRSKGLWDVPHPWMNLLVPRSGIHEFATQVFENLLTDSNNGPILVYPVNKSSWNNETFFVTPEEDIMYLVGLLSSAVPKSDGQDGMDYIQSQNKKILSFCSSRGLGVKQYLPHYHTYDEWKLHFGSRWELFELRKMCYDPLGILAPGQNIFRRQ